MILFLKGVLLAIVIIIAVAMIFGFSVAIYIGHLIDD